MISSDSIQITVDIKSLSAVRTGEDPPLKSEINFNLNANLKEVSREEGRAVVDYMLVISSEPSVVKLQVEGLAFINGEKDGIERLLSSNSDRKVPDLLYEVYRQVYPHIFVLAAAIRVPYPSPGLLYAETHSTAQTE